jgi:cell division protease FtsH
MKNNTNNIVVWALAIFLVAILYNLVSDVKLGSKRMPFSEFLKELESDKINRVSIRGNIIEGETDDGRQFDTLAPNFYPQLIDELHKQNVRIDIAPTETSLGNFLGMIIQWFPALLLAGVWIYFMKNMQNGGNRAMGFGKSRARMLSENAVKVTFADVAGIEEAKEELEEIVDFLREPNKFKRLGGKIPRGCLLVGSPGTGKTLLAKAIAGEAKVPFFTISGSDFVEMFVGVGASRVRDMFTQAKKHAPCILFIDEIDAVGRHRGAGLGGGNDEREQTLNQLLVEMDGFNENEGVIVIAATNRPDVLDPALLRPGRFDRQITVSIPDIKGRTKILEVHLKKVPLGDNVNVEVLARGTPGFAGADLANLVNEAALLAARMNQKYITMETLESAKDKVLMGVERKSMIISDEQKKLTAYHEGGHALIALHMPASDPLHKATIIPRGRALGVTMRLPEDDRYSVTREKLEADIAVAMGGRVAEELVFGAHNVTTGAQNDIKMATTLARRMVTQWGLSDKIGPLLVGDQQEEVFLGHSIGKNQTISEKMMQDVDGEISRLVNDGHETAKKILTKYSDQLHKLAEALIEKESMSGEEIKNLLGLKKQTPKKKNKKELEVSEEMVEG